MSVPSPTPPSAGSPAHPTPTGAEPDGAYAMGSRFGDGAPAAPLPTGGLVGLLPERLRARPQAAQAAQRFEERPELEVAAAFALGLIVAVVLRKVSS